MTTAVSLILETARRGELHHALILHGPSTQLLRDLSIRGRRLSVVLHLPDERGSGGALPVVSRRLNGVELASESVPQATTEEAVEVLPTPPGPDRVTWGP